jgi:hypothetical protein
MIFSPTEDLSDWFLSFAGEPMSRLSVKGVQVLLIVALCAANCWGQAAQPRASVKGHYLLVWAGDRAKLGNDFLAVIDADPSSPAYGHLVTTLATDQRTDRVHHTEYTMPASGMLFANDHDVGRTFIFDVRDPLHPKIAASFTDMAGDDQGKVVRSVSNADPAFAGALLMPYSLVIIPEVDRIVSTNSSMHNEDIFSGVTYQVWRLSDLKLLKTAYFDVGDNLYAHISPEEPRLGPDGSVFVQTLGCGIERITAVESSAPKSRLIYTFPGNWCGVPTIVGHYLVQSVPQVHGFIVLDIANAEKPKEVSRLTLSDTFGPHWTGWDPKTRRLVVTPYESEADRTYLLKLDETTGAISVDTDFRDTDGKPGFSFAERDWPHGWKGAAKPHGAVFTR